VNVTVVDPGVYETVPATCAPPDVVASLMVVVLIDVGSIGSLNVSVTAVDVETLLAPLAGTTPVTVGCVPVMKVHSTCEASPLPATSLAPVVMRAV
jgi:hypothetical protein